MTPRQNRERPAKGRTWSYIAGEKGRNRVRVYDRAERGIWIDYRDEHGGRTRHALGHADRERAKLEADEVAVRFRRQDAAPPAAMTLQRLFDMYEREVTPRKSVTAAAHDRRALPILLRAFGAKRRPATLNRRDWDSYIERRRTGELSAQDRAGKPVRTRVLEQDLGLLNAVLNWAVRAGDGVGGYLLERNPLLGLHAPREESPRRAVLTREQFDRVRVAAAECSPNLECFAMLAWYTGHRAKSIRMLRWSDVELDIERIHWRGENDKIDYDHWNPLHAAAVAVLRAERARAGAIGDAWIFPSARDARLPLSGNAMVNIWKRLAVKAGLPVGERYGWHSCRRAFANTLRNVALRDLKDLGGWKSDRTVVAVYQQPSEPAQRQGLRAFDLVSVQSTPPAPQQAPATGTTNS